MRSDSEQRERVVRHAKAQRSCKAASYVVFAESE
jgi:hypothetical protein